MPKWLACASCARRNSTREQCHLSVGGFEAGLDLRRRGGALNALHEVCLGAVRAKELAVRILAQEQRGLFAPVPASRSCRTTRGARQDSTATLRSDNMSRLFSVVHDRVGLHQRSRAIWRRDTGLGHNTTGWHRTEGLELRVYQREQEQWAADEIRLWWS